MKTLYTIAFGIVAGLIITSEAKAQTSTIAPPVDKGFQAYREAVKIGARVATEPACEKIIDAWAMADARHSTKPATTSFSCNGQKVYVATTTPIVCEQTPPTTATISCVSPLVGSWVQNTTTTRSAPTCDPVAAVSPASAPAGSCAPAPVVTPPEPPASGPVTMPTNPFVPIADASKWPKLVRNPANGWDREMIITTTEIAPDSDVGAFRTGCQSVKWGYFDPIVYRGLPNSSHLHLFQGNMDINPSSTPESLLASGNSTCRGGPQVNRSGYWSPALIDMRTQLPVAPLFEGINAYYKGGTAIDPTTIRPMPPGLVMIAGNSKGTPASKSSGIFACVWDGGNSDWYDHIPTDCQVKGFSWLIAAIDFSQCNNGYLNSPDFKSHMAAPINVRANGSGNCPASHPFPIPAIAFQILYQYKSVDDLKNWRFSSDNYPTTFPAGYSFHADWMGAWRQDIVESFVKNCINGKKDGHSHLLCDPSPPRRALVIP